MSSSPTKLVKIVTIVSLGRQRSRLGQKGCICLSPGPGTCTVRAPPLPSRPVLGCTTLGSSLAPAVPPATCAGSLVTRQKGKSQPGNKLRVLCPLSGLPVTLLCRQPCHQLWKQHTVPVGWASITPGPSESRAERSKGLSFCVWEIRVTPVPENSVRVSSRP